MINGIVCFSCEGAQEPRHLHLLTHDILPQGVGETLRMPEDFARVMVLCNQLNLIYSLIMFGLPFLAAH